MSDSFAFFCIDAFKQRSKGCIYLELGFNFCFNCQTIYKTQEEKENLFTHIFAYWVLFFFFLMFLSSIISFLFR